MSDLFDSVVVELPRDAKLLHHFYHKLIVPNFPIASEVESLQVWIDQLEGHGRYKSVSSLSTSSSSIQKKPSSSSSSSSPSRVCILNILVAFSSRDVSHSRPLGGIVFEYYYPSNCALITYLVISSHVRGQGLAIYLTIKAYELMRQMSAIYNHEQPYIIFCEVNDPTLISEDDDAYSPLTRIRAFQNAGVRVVQNFPYIQPSLDHSTPKARDMLLAAVVGPMTDRDEQGAAYIQASQLSAFLHDFYAELLGSNYQQDPDFVTMINNIKQRSASHIYLVDFDLSRFKQSSNSNKKKRQHHTDTNLSTSAALSTTTSTSTTDPTLPHIIVVGAGIAGLSCASLLHAAGFPVTVVEARHRTGGRIYTSRTFDTRIDLGAAWIHGLDGNPLYQYVLTHLPNLQLYPSQDQSLMLYDLDGSKIDDTIVMTVYMKFLALCEDLHALYSSDSTANHVHTKTHTSHISTATAAAPHRSVADALQYLYTTKSSVYQYQNSREKVVMNYFLSQLESLHNAQLSQMPAMDFDYGMIYEGGDHLVKTGYQHVIVSLSETINTQQQLKLSTPVTAIHYDEHGVAIQVNGAAKEGNTTSTTTGNEFIRGQAVVMTVPIGVIHSQSIQFHPPLPAWKSNAYNGIEAGLFNKVVLHFSSVWWAKHIDYFAIHYHPTEADNNTQQHNNSLNEDLSQLHRQRSNVWFVNYFPITQKPILVAMLSGQLAVELQGRDVNYISNYLLVRLRHTHRHVTIPPPVDVVCTAWGLDEYARCSYSYLALNGSVQDFEAAAAPVYCTKTGEPRIYFAGEHTSKERFGYADGAYASGCREAERIITRYKLNTTKQHNIDPQSAGQKLIQLPSKL